jgi:hypothetical protein
MIKLRKSGESTIHYVKVDVKSDIDKISTAFDVFTDPSITDEVILNTASINECEDATSVAIQVFSEAVWDELPVGLVLFHG